MKEVIESHENQRDLGIQMSNSGSFEFHIDSIIKKARQRIGWICRTFRHREAMFMRRMFITFVRPHLDYCSQLWSPNEGPLLDKIEKVLKDFTNLIPEIHHLEYCDRLKYLNMTSMQRRYDRYKIMYIKKILCNLVPNIGIIIRHTSSHRNGLMLDTMNSKVSILRRATFQFTAPKIFNLLPKDLRNHDGSMDNFKLHLDEFLSLIPDEPRLDKGSKLYSNTLEHQLNNWSWTIKFDHS